MRPHKEPFSSQVKSSQEAVNPTVRGSNAHGANRPGMYRRIRASFCDVDIIDIIGFCVPCMGVEQGPFVWWEGEVVWLHEGAAVIDEIGRDKLRWDTLLDDWRVEQGPLG